MLDAAANYREAWRQNTWHQADARISHERIFAFRAPHGRLRFTRNRCTSVLGLFCLALPCGIFPAPTYGSGHSEMEAPVLELTLAEAIRLALQNNRTLTGTRLQRDVQRFSLEVAEDEYRPKASLNASADVYDDGREMAGISPQMNLDIPTGGRFSLKWSKPLAGEGDRHGRWTLDFSQPLLKGAGLDIDMVPLRTARINERMNILSFRDTAAGIVESVISAYRAVIRADREIQISGDALERAKEQLEVNRTLIKAGRMAENEIIRTEAEVANRKLGLVQSENGLVSANSRLVNFLDIAGITRIKPTETLNIEEVRPDFEKSVKIALQNRRDYLKALLELEIAKMDLRVAEDGLLWDLTLDASMMRDSSDSGRKNDYSMGLQLNIPLWRRPLKFSVVRGRRALRQAEINLAESRQQIQIEVLQATQDVELGFQQVILARKARKLAQKKLDIERKKLNEGLTSTFRLTSTEDDLIQAENTELNAALSYLTALTEFDRVLGVTLERWDIELEEVE